MLLKDLRISPLRTFLTGMSMFVGIVAVILSVLAGGIGDSYLKSTNDQLYGRTPTVSVHLDDIDNSNFESLVKFDKLLNGGFHAASLVASPSNSYKVSLTNLSSLENLYTSSALRLTEQLGNVEYMFVTDSYRDVFNLPISSGRWFTNNENARLEAVVNKAAFSTSRHPTSAVISSPQSTNVTEVPIVGVVNDGVDSPRAYINVLPSSYYLSNTWDVNQATIYIWNMQNLSESTIRSRLDDLVFDSLGGRITDISPSAGSSAFNQVALAAQIAFAICASLLLFVSCLGLFNIGLASLEQRSRELLIRRALGATRASIASLVLGGAVLISLIVSTTAIAIAFICVKSIPAFLPTDTPISPPGFPLTAAYVAVLCAVFTALAGSMIPAIRAAKLEPALALR